MQEKKDNSKEDEASGHSGTFVQQKVKEKKRKGSLERKAEGSKQKSRYVLRPVELKVPTDIDLELWHQRETRRAQI